MFVRNVGHLMTNPAILDAQGEEVLEGIMDAMVTVMIAIHGPRKTGGPRNSLKGSVNVAKPKMHGPEEVAFVSRNTVMNALRRMETIDDRQNVGDPNYRPMGPGFQGIAFRAACDLMLLGRQQPSGYAEPVLHRRRTEEKAGGCWCQKDAGWPDGRRVVIISS